MGFIEILSIAIGLSMDAASVSMTNGMCYKKQYKLRQTLLTALAFGIFQAVMPLIGYFAGTVFSGLFQAFDHWIALILLGIIGGKMLFDGIRNEDEQKAGEFSIKMLLVQAVATSIDALAVGVSFTNLVKNIGVAALIIGVTTFILSFIAVFIGKRLGDKLNSKAQIFGGTILILIGLKIFIEHMFF
ncbi:MAG: manganese efflux pump MntP family protein [Oscillospiraceae bacterium]